MPATPTSLPMPADADLTAWLLAGIRSWVNIESHTADVAGVNACMDACETGWRDIGAAVTRIPGTALPGVAGGGDHLLVGAPWNRPGTNAPGVLILCHLDTVHPKGTIQSQLPFRIDGDRAYGPGIYDMKGGAYLAFAAVRAIAAERPASDTCLPVRLLYVADEEIGSPTSRALIEQEGARAKFVLVVEPARDGGKIVTARKGVGRFFLTAHGRPAHAGTSHVMGRSAIVELARQIVAIEAMTDYARGLTFNFGQISGGTADNVVPGQCTATLDMRVTSVADGEMMVAQILARHAYDPDVRLEISGGLNRPPYQQTAAGAALFDHARAVAAPLGIDLVGVATGGGSDANFVADKVATLDGLGVDGAGAHTLDEHLLISSLAPRFKLLKGLLETLG
jgi:glutamate carboxypeptidase